MALYFCYVTAGSRDEALTIGRAVVEERLAACANVLDGLTSIYWWQGALEQAGEAVLILKTRAELVDRLTSRIGSCTATSVRAWSRSRSMPATPPTSSGSPGKPGRRRLERTAASGLS